MQKVNLHVTLTYTLYIGHPYVHQTLIFFSKVHFRYYCIIILECTSLYTIPELTEIPIFKRERDGERERKRKRERERERVNKIITILQQQKKVHNII